MHKNLSGAVPSDGICFPKGGRGPTCPPHSVSLTATDRHRSMSIMLSMQWYNQITRLYWLQNSQTATTTIVCKIDDSDVWHEFPSIATSKFQQQLSNKKTVKQQNMINTQSIHPMQWNETISKLYPQFKPTYLKGFWRRIQQRTSTQRYNDSRGRQWESARAEWRHEHMDLCYQNKPISLTKITCKIMICFKLFGG